MMDASAVMDKLPTPKIPSRSSVTTNDVTMDVTTGIACQVTAQLFQKIFKLVEGNFY